MAEVAATYEGNAQRKALSYSAWCQRPVITDDAGLEVLELGGLPGVHTAGIGVSRFLKWLSPGRVYRARFVCCACYAKPNGRVVSVLGAIEGLDLVPLTDGDQCCGSAGIYNLIEPEVSDRVLAPKLANIAATHAQIVATGNPGCLMQIGAGLARSGSAAVARHPVELLDASYGRRARAGRSA